MVWGQGVQWGAGKALSSVPEASEREAFTAGPPRHRGLSLLSLLNTSLSPAVPGAYVSKGDGTGVRRAKGQDKRVAGGGR